MKEFEKFLEDNHPGIDECMVCLSVSEKRKEYLLIEKHKIANGFMFTINSRFFYDYNFLWDETGPWKICWKSK